MTPPTDVVMRRAANWHARLAAADAAAADREAFERWLAADPAHAEAWAAVQSADQRLKSALRTDPRLRALAEAALEPPASDAVEPPHGAGKRR